MAHPTASGLRRYPHTEGYFPDLGSVDTVPDRDLPCVCTDRCEARCAGECGCHACGTAFNEFCSVAGFFGPDGRVDDEQGALERYRA